MADLWDKFTDLQKERGMKRYLGSIWVLCKFDGIEDRMFVLPYDRLALEMDNGVALYVNGKLNQYDRRRLIQVLYCDHAPYDPYACKKCRKAHDCRGDAAECCEPLVPGESEDTRFERIHGGYLRAAVASIDAALEFTPAGVAIPYDISEGIVLDSVH